MEKRDELIAELLKIHNQSIKDLTKLCETLSEALIEQIEFQSTLYNRIQLLEQSVVYKELPNE
jgi:hypothetical protein